MRTSIVALAVLLGMQAANAEPTTPAALISRAIAAQAGKPGDLTKWRIECVLMEGRFYHAVAPAPIVREVFVEGPDRVRYNNTLKSPQGAQRLILCLNKN